MENKLADARFLQANKDDLVYLKHILDAVREISKYLKNISERKFHKNTLIQSAVIRQLEIIGEATKKLSDKIKVQYETVPWKDIAGMRDKLIHDYFGVDLNAVWKTVQEDISDFKKIIRKILKDLE